MKQTIFVNTFEESDQLGIDYDFSFVSSTTDISELGNCASNACVDWIICSGTQKEIDLYACGLSVLEYIEIKGKKFDLSNTTLIILRKNDEKTKDPYVSCDFAR